MSEIQCGVYPTEAQSPPIPETLPDVCQACISPTSKQEQSSLGNYNLASRFQRQKEAIQSANCPIDSRKKGDILAKLDEEEALAMVAKNTEVLELAAEVEIAKKLKEKVLFNAENRNPYACTEREISGEEIYRDLAGKAFGELDYVKRDALAIKARQRLLQARQEVANEIGKPEQEIQLSRGFLAEVIDDCAQEIEKNIEGSKITSWIEETSAGKVEYSINRVVKEEETPNFLELKIARHGDRGTGIVHPEEIISKDWKIFEARKIDGQIMRLIYPEDPDFEQIVGLEYHEIIKFLDSMPTVVDSKRTLSQKEVNIYLMNPSNLPREFADGNDMFISINSQLNGLCSRAIFAHEAVHSLLESNYGRCLVDSLEEGAAMYYAGKRFPGDRVWNYAPSLSGSNDVFEAIASSSSPALSHTHLLEQKPEIKASKVQDYDYSYSLGSVFVEYFISQYGNDAFLQLMQRTSANRENLYDRQTGQPVIKKGMRVSSQQAVMEAALRSLELRPEEVKESFGKYVKEHYTSTPIELQSSKAAISV